MADTAETPSPVAANEPHVSSLQQIRSRVDRMGNRMEAKLPMNSINATTAPLFRKKDLMTMGRESEGGEEDGTALNKCLGPVDLTAIGVGCIVGAGIFVLTGVAAHEKAGPSLIFSFLFAGLACVFSALCYAEFAARVPVAGSAYTYAYTTVGEFIAWIIGWNLVLEYTIGAATVARGWSGYLVELLSGFNIEYPLFLYAYHLENPVMDVTIDVTAAASIIVITMILAVGVKESTTFNMIVVIITMAVIGFIIVSGFYLGTKDNWDPFFPYGVSGVFRGSASIFFAYVGFDAVATAAEEAKNPKRDLPIGILASLGISTVLYVLVTAVLTLMVPYNLINNNSPLAAAFGYYDWGWAKVLVAFGAFAALTTSILGNLMSQPRIFFSMARDGLLFEWFAQIHPKFHTPMNATLTTGAASALLALLLDIETLADMVSIGTLLAFTIVCGAVLTIRYSCEARPYQSIVFTTVFIAFISLSALLFALGTHWGFYVGVAACSLVPGGFLFLQETQNLPDTFNTPLVPLIPLLGITFNIFMMANLSYSTWIRLMVWLIIGVVFYFLYGVRHSKLRVVKNDQGSSNENEEEMAEIEETSENKETPEENL